VLEKRSKKDHFSYHIVTDEINPTGEINSLQIQEILSHCTSTIHRRFFFLEAFFSNLYRKISLDGWGILGWPSGKYGHFHIRQEFALVKKAEK